jgi:hypothetical protein
MTVTVSRLVARKATWTMTAVELARVFADHFGYTTSPRSNWVYDPAGRPVACGWHEFAARLQTRGWIRVGVGVNWRRAGESPRLGRRASASR